jgi:hypothetical protein
MKKTLYVVEGHCFITAYSPEEARRKFGELVTRNPLMNTPVDRIGDPTYVPPDRANLSELVRIRPANEQERKDFGHYLEDYVVSPIAADDGGGPETHARADRTEQGRLMPMIPSPFRFEEKLTPEDYQTLGKLSLRWSHIEHMIANCLKMQLRLSDDEARIVIFPLSTDTRLQRMRAEVVAEIWTGR